MEEQKRKNPWLGLESYREGEVLYGRDDDIRDLTQSVLNDIDTLLYGKSGIGKSSILNAGIIPAARRHGYLPVLVRLSHKEQHSYLFQIKNAIANVTRIREVVDCKDKEKESLYEFFHRHTFHDENGGRVKLLVIFDQFEEIFTLQTDESKKKRFFAELADFLNDVMPSELQREVVTHSGEQEEVDVADSANLDDLFNELDLKIDDDLPEYVTDNDVHLVFTIREDFLSEFEYYSASIPSLKQNRYGLRPINEEQASQIILRPMPGLIDDSVAKLIIEKVTGRGDFELDGIPEIEVDSAVLSLYLNRLFEAKTGDKITSELVENKGGEIIADFYNDAISSISESTIEYLEDMLLNGQGRRDNITVFDAIHDGGATEQELDILCNKKKILRQFNYAGDLRIEYVHDILCPVVKEHKEERRLLKQQEEEKAKIAAEREKILRQQRRERRRFRRAMMWALGIILFIVAAWLFNSYWNQWEYEEYYQSFTRRNGWPVGVGEELKNQDVGKLAVCYRLVRKGRNPSKPFSRVEVCSSTQEVFLPNFRSPLVGAVEKDDKMANDFSSLNMKVRTIRFSGENESVDASVSRESYYDKNESLLFAINYYRSIAQDIVENVLSTSSIWAVYVDQNGLPLKIRDNGADRMKVFLSSSDQDEMDKLEVKYMFYDEKGSPQTNDIGCYGFRIVYNNDLTIDSLFHLDPFSLEKFVEVRQYEAPKVISTYISVGTGKVTTHNSLGYAKRIDTSDEKGNIVERSYYNQEGNPISDMSHCALEKRHYDNYNRVDSVSFYDGQGKLTEYRIYKYATLSTIFSEESRYVVSNDNQARRIYYKSHHAEGNVTDNIEDDAVRQRYRHEHILNDSIRHIMEYSFFNREGKLTYDSLEQCYRYTKRTTNHGEGQICVIKYYGADNELYFNPDNARIAAVDSAYYDKDGLKRTQVTFDAAGHVLKSMGYDYKDGVEITRYALSLDGHTPIRCPEWEIDGLCYYRLNNVKNAQTGFNLAYIQTVSEYVNCPSLIYFPDATETVLYAFNPVIQTIGEQWQREESVTISIPSKPENAPVVQYVHITSLNGSAYQAGLRDGDLLQERRDISPTECLITVVRYENHVWKKPNSFRISKSNIGMEVYPIAYTKEEYAEYQKGRSSL